ncbi:DUF1329 domain-containing protein [Zavarzinia compransoris]|uniref:DUF1329 domain-containing protein n=1 Tax=Zavarzinia marina TaxID=2911065 RepID=UPI001F181787|nr:DUF1329 domain-containing protein [Zavarzinia marina]MCF4164110.1 DUF1329 domain-containing protein [Zavarzinia marina]
MRRRDFMAGGAAALAFAGRMSARASTEEIARLGTALTPFGAEREGSADGLLAPYSGRWLGAPPGIAFAGTGAPQADPYAAEKPLFSIDAGNVGQHAARLSEGQKAMFRKFPDSFRMDVYPCHRDFRFGDDLLANLKRNAAEAALTPDGEGVTGVYGAPAFPFPKTGLELIWNAITVPRPFTMRGTMDEAVVYPNGTIAWGAQKWDIYCPSYDPAVARADFDGTSALVYRTTLKPEREAGTVVLAREYWDFARRPTQAWTYVPGTRRVKQVAEVAGDYPVGPGGFHTVDDTGLWAQSPRRYDWELVGKREIFVPYNAFRIDDPALRYTDLLGAAHLNPDHLRWELHRCWVVRAKLKPGLRHVYGARTIYLDEDSLNPVVADLYDPRGDLYRLAMNTIAYDYATRILGQHVCIYYDLVSGAYMVDRLTNEVSDRPRCNEGDREARDYSPQALARKAI